MNEADDFPTDPNDPRILWLYVVLDKPTDYPKEFVCRRQFPWAGKVYWEKKLFARADNLEDLIAKLPSGLAHLPRDKGDPGDIVGTWI